MGVLCLCCAVAGSWEDCAQVEQEAESELQKVPGHVKVLSPAFLFPRPESTPARPLPAAPPITSTPALMNLIGHQPITPHLMVHTYAHAPCLFQRNVHTNYLHVYL